MTMNLALPTAGTALLTLAMLAALLTVGLF